MICELKVDLQLPVAVWSKLLPFRYFRKIRNKERPSPSLHSQRMRTDQPCFLRVASTFLSRITFRANFCIQKDVFVFGVELFLQPCRCQKQPCTKMAFLVPRMTKSGEPGSELTFLSYFTPNFISTAAIIRSGLVPLERTCDK